MSTSAVAASSSASTLLTARPDTKQSWHNSIDLSARRTVLLHILMLLKSKYGKVDSKISYIGRRAELALYSQAFSAWEYRNPQTLSRRLHSLVVKLHLNNLAALEDAAFAMELVGSASSRKRKCSTDEQPVGKRARYDLQSLQPPVHSSLTATAIYCSMCVVLGGSRGAAVCGDVLTGGFATAGVRDCY
ncbi:hypothetical protein GQ600_4139 [Phytophthora cactorum]|nr:hypothetical protein GQ600_4139 [Phytophthora cactorum]